MAASGFLGLPRFFGAFSTVIFLDVAAFFFPAEALVAGSLGFLGIALVNRGDFFFFPAATFVILFFLGLPALLAVLGLFIPFEDPDDLFLDLAVCLDFDDLVVLLVEVLVRPPFFSGVFLVSFFLGINLQAE